jgi:hypothetical protein
MAFEKFVTGTVFRYPCLWLREGQNGETEGRKQRPVAVGVRIREQNGQDILIVLPITSKMPEGGRFTSEIPDAEKRRAGLDPDLRLWIILDEYNGDVIGKSYYLTNREPLGQFSKSYFLPLITEFVRRKRAIKGIDRTR